jgi:spore germination protein KB
LFARTLYPLLAAFQLISLADFIENVDPLVVTIFLLGGLFKILLFFYGACTGIRAQWRLHSHRSVVLPVFILVWLLAIFMTDNISSHIFVGLHWVPWVLWVPLFIMIPLLLVPISWWKRKGRTANEGDNHT